MSAYVVWSCLVYGQVLVRGYRPQIRHNDFRLTTHMSPFSFQGEKALCTQRMCCSRAQVCRDACELAHFMGGGRCHRYTTECNIPGRLHTVGQLTIMFLKDEGIPGQPIGRQIGRRRRTAVPLPQCSFRATVRLCKVCNCLRLPTACVSDYYSLQLSPTIATSAIKPNYSCNPCNIYHTYYLCTVYIDLSARVSRA